MEKRPISFQCDQCTFKYTSENVLNEHKKIRHKPSNKRAKTSFTPTSSPPNKKHDGIEKGPDIEINETEVEMMDLEVKQRI